MSTSSYLARLLLASFFSLICLTSSEPLRAMTAMSEVGSLRGSTMSPPRMPTTCKQERDSSAAHQHPCKRGTDVSAPRAVMHTHQL